MGCCSLAIDDTDISRDPLGLASWAGAAAQGICWTDAQGPNSGTLPVCSRDWCRLPGTDAYTAPPPFDPSSTLVTYVNDGLSGGGYCGPRGGRANADLSQCAFGAALVHNEPLAWHASGIGSIYKSTIDGCPYKSWAIYACYADHSRTTLAPDGCQCTYTADDCPAARPNLDTTFYPSGDVCTSEVAPIALPLNPL